MKPYYEDKYATLYNGDVLDVLRELPAGIIQTCVTSPPYWSLRDYQVNGQIGLEKTPENYIEKMVSVFREVKRVLRDDGTIWVNMGDSYAGGGRAGEEGIQKWGGIESNNQERKYAPPTKIPYNLKSKDLCGIPWQLAFALQADGWYLRSDIIWYKPNPMPESITDRPTKSHEYIFLLSKKPKYYYDAEAIREDAPLQTRKGTPPERLLERTAAGCSYNNSFQKDKTTYGRNKRTVWTIATQPFTEQTQTSHLYPVLEGEVYDDMKHIVSPDCPIHGGIFDLVSMALCDEHEVYDLIRNGRIDDYPDLKLEHDSVQFDQLHAYYFQGNNLDYWLRHNFPSARLHNKKIHKTVLALLTNPSCKPSVQRIVHILHILELHDSSELIQNIYENNIWPDVMDVHFLDQIIYRNINKSSSVSSLSPNCACKLYYKRTEKSSHFATFPPKLIEPCILAGTSEKGVCSKCGAPWERIMSEAIGGTKGKSWHHHENDMVTGNAKRQTGSEYLSYISGKTIGWKPSCSCNADTIPGIVLDPFAGSGTVGAVSKLHRRRSILIELNAKYCDMIVDRIRAAVPGDSIDEYKTKKIPKLSLF